MFNELKSGRWASAVDHLMKGDWKIRKLTPRECFRLQGIDDELFEKAEFVNGDSQLYKQIGNAVSVPVIELIGRRMNEPRDI